MSSALRRIMRHVWFMGLLGCTLAAVAGSAGCSGTEDDLNKSIPKLIESWKGPNNLDMAGDLFNSTNPDARRIAIAHISKKKWGHEPPYMKAYHMLATKDPEPLVRAQALRALGASHDPSVAPDLLDGLKHTDPQVRRDAAAALQDLANDATVEPMLEALKNDPDAQVRVNLAKALMQYKQARVMFALADALDDKDVAVVHWAQLSLQSQTGEDFPTDRKVWVDWLRVHYPLPVAKTTG